MRGLGGTGKECSELGHWLQEDKVCPFILPVHLLRLQMLLLCKPVRFQHASQREMNHAQQSDSDSLSLSLSISRHSYFSEQMKMNNEGFLLELTACSLSGCLFL